MAPRSRRTFALIALITLVALVGCGRSRQTSTTTGATTTQKAPSAQTIWLCFPGRASNPCVTPLTATEIRADGTTRVRQYTPAVSPPIDCFYVYPTVSDANTGNASRVVGIRETLVAQAQASQFSRVCRVFAPMYRQITERGLVDGSLHARPLLAYNDVLAAWRWYLAHENHGRGVVLVGHSQGAYVLKHLVTTVIDRSPSERRLLVSAILLGGQVKVAATPGGKGDFQNVPPCATTRSIGCVVAYSSFDHRPPARARFGRSADTAVRIACVNPASPTGGKAPLSALFPTLVLRWLAPNMKAPSTPWVAFPGLYSAECLRDGTARWLQVDHSRTPGDTRPIVRPTFGHGWGLHGVDLNIALGDLVSLVAAQSATYTSTHQGPIGAAKPA